MGILDNMIDRTEIYETVKKMIDEYPVFGSGPGSFEAVAQFELGETFIRWESWAHNDYQEFYLTFGKLGGSNFNCTGSHSHPAMFSNFCGRINPNHQLVCYSQL